MAKTGIAKKPDFSELESILRRSTARPWFLRREPARLRLGVPQGRLGGGRREGQAEPLSAE